MTSTYREIASVTVSASTSAAIEFTSIPGTYTDLVIKSSLRSNRATNEDVLGIKLNTSSSNFTSRELQGTGASVSTNASTSGRIAVINATSSQADAFSSTEIYIADYTDSKNKVISTDSVQVPGILTVQATTWAQTSVITAVSLYPLFGTALLQYSTATLYGIEKA